MPVLTGRSDRPGCRMPAPARPRPRPVLGDGRLVLSYDVNRPETTGAAVMLSRNVSLYRPRFVTVRLVPGR